jgi:hypothetical protein
MSQGFREFAKVGLSGTATRNMRFTLTTSGGVQLGDQIVKAIDGVDIAQTVGVASSIHYLEFQLQVGAVEWTNTTGSAWSASKIRVEVWIGSAYQQVGTITFAPSGQTVGVNFKIAFSSLRFTYSNREGLSTLISNSGYSTSKNWQFEVQNSSLAVMVTTNTSGLPTVRTSTGIFVDSGTTAMISSGNTDSTNGSGASFTADRVRVNVRPGSSGAFFLIGTATHTSTQVLANEILRLTNITFTFSVPTT